MRLEQRYALFYAVWLYAWLEARRACQIEISMDRLHEPAYRDCVQTRLAALGIDGIDLENEALSREFIRHLMRLGAS